MAQQLRRRDDYDPNVRIRFERRGPEPVTQEQMVGGKERCDAQREWAAMRQVGQVIAQAGRSRDSCLPQGARESQAAAVAVEHKGGQNFAARTTLTQLHGPEDRRGSLGGVQFAVDNFVPDRGPTNFPAELHAESLLGKVPQLLREQQRGGIG
jgi:hypothetical protein